jgi:hypothetical protein
MHLEPTIQTLRIESQKESKKGVILLFTLYLTPGCSNLARSHTMYIEEIVLEGFKSYATRTVIPAWDPKFNAITGLNGSGKSNILDAICFVLGIDNLKQVKH